MKLPTRPETFACHPAEVAGDGFFPVHEPHISANEYPHNQMKSIQIGDLKITLPIIQGGMGVGVSLDGLAGAVAACGGMGTLSTAVCGFQEPDFAKRPCEANLRALDRQVRHAKVLAHGAGLIAVNAMVATTQYADSVRTALSQFFHDQSCHIRFSDIRSRSCDKNISAHFLSQSPLFNHRDHSFPDDCRQNAQRYISRNRQ
mgnify:CR=1 FL=1